MSKYKNKIVEVDGIKFHSKLEARYYQQLKWAKEGKTLKDFQLQPKFILQDKFEKNGKKIRAITYSADFLVTDNEGNQSVIDIKGSPKMTEAFKLKYKMFEAKFPHTLTILHYKEGKGWYEGKV